MRLLLSLVLLCFPAFAADFVVNGSVIAEFQTIPANRVKQLRSDIAAGYSPGDILPTSVEFTTTTNASIISGWLRLDFVVSNNAAANWQRLTNYSFAPGTTGSLSFHMCAINVANTNCRPCSSPEASFMQKNFP